MHKIAIADGLVGRSILLFCLNYIYTGTLVAVTDDSVVLEKAQIVYETGAFTTPGYADAQPLPGDKWYVQRTAIESYGIGK